MPKNRWWSSLVVLLAAVLAVQAPPLLLASRLPTPPLDPATYTSPSGEFQLHIDPSDREGAGPGVYTMSRKGAVQWSGERAVTLREAQITDRGEVVGYGYTDGLEIYKARGEEPGYGDLVLWILNPDGSPRMERRFKREWSRIMDTDPDPTSGEPLASVEGDWAMFNLWQWRNGRGHPSHYVVRLSDGELIHHRASDEFKDAAGESYAYFARNGVVLGTPYALCEVRAKDSRVAILLDPRDRIVWSRSVPSAPYGPWMWEQTVLTIGSDASGEFSLFDAEAGEAVVYTVAGEGDSLTVAEKSRSAYVVPRRASPESKWMKSTEYTPEFLGDIALRTVASGSDSPIRDVRAFALDEAGNIALVRGGGSGGTSETLLLVSESGGVLKELPIPGDRRAIGRIASLGGGRFALLAVGPFSGGSLFSADLNIGEFTAPVDLDCTRLLSLSVFSNGDLLILTSKHHRYHISETLSRRAPDGSVVWSKETGGYRVPEDFWQAHSAAVLAGDEAAVLRTVSRDVQVFGPDGEFRRLVSLKAGWGRDPNYPTDIVAAPEAGYLIRDFNGPQRMVECDAEGRMRREFTPSFADGYTFDGSAHFAPSGSLWATDGNVLVRLNREGREETRIGPPSDANALKTVLGISVSRDGLIHAVDKRTYNVFVHDETGVLLRRCVPQPSDFPPNQHRLKVAFLHGGGFVLSTTSSLISSAIEFSPTGQRVGPYASSVRGVSDVLFQPDGSRRWITDYRRIILEEMSGTRIATIDRDSRGHWISGVMYPSVAPDGSLAVNASQSGETLLFAPDGKPLGALNAPGYGSHLDFDGKWIARSAGGAIYLTRADGSGSLWLPFPEMGEHWPQPYLLPARGELWTWDGKSPLLKRFRLPD